MRIRNNLRFTGGLIFVLLIYFFLNFVMPPVPFLPAVVSVVVAYGIGLVIGMLMEY